jgi:hypothetical protein
MPMILDPFFDFLLIKFQSFAPPIAGERLVFDKPQHVLPRTA